MERETWRVANMLAVFEVRDGEEWVWKMCFVRVDMILEMVKLDAKKSSSGDRELRGQCVLFR